jgi:hypothetical protein
MTSATETDGDTDDYTEVESRKKKRRRVRTSSGGGDNNGNTNCGKLTASKTTNKPLYSQPRQNAGKCLEIKKGGLGSSTYINYIAGIHLKPAFPPSREKAVFDLYRQRKPRR